jgi:hypothetical protein
LQAAAPQVPPAQSSVQHSPDDAQSAPCGLQKEAATQTGDAPLQMPEQHALLDGSQVAPAPRQTEAGDAQAPGVPAEVSHRPEQQSSAAVQAAVSAAHWPAGLVQTPLAHALVQQ